MHQLGPVEKVAPLASQSDRSATGQWLVLAAAFLGWMFDGVEMGLFPAVGPSALKDLLGHVAASATEINRWNSYITAGFLVGAACGGVLFGWLGDRIGRVRAMVLSILAYSLFAGACYFVTSAWQFGALRFAAALGMGGEWALGVALVMECWPERFRPLLAGVIGAAGNLGYLLIGALVTRFPVKAGHWRWTMLACATPALLALFILAFLPESARWKRAVGRSTVRPLREIFTTRLIRPTLLAIGLASVALIGTWGTVQSFLSFWANEMGSRLMPPDDSAKGATVMAVASGAIVGGLIAPLVGGKIGRRKAYFGLCLLSLAVCQFMFHALHQYNVAFLATACLAGACTASFYGWLPLYLPELFPTRVRATGQGLSYNFGRIFAAVGVLCTASLLHRPEGGVEDPSAIPRACATISLVYIVGMVIIWFGPETKGKPLPE